MKYSIALVLSVSFLFSCSSKYEEELKDLDEVKFTLSTLKTTFEDVDMDAVSHARKTYKENMEQVKEYYRSDTIGIEFGNTLNHYKGIKKVGKNMDQLFLNYSSDLKMMGTQLENLETDIANNSLHKDSIASFIDFERVKIEELGDNIGTFIINCEYIIEIHDSLADKVRGYTAIF